MVDTSQIREHMDVVSADDRHLGRVDHVKGTEIELARIDLPAKGEHHLIPVSWIDRVDDKVRLNLSFDAAEARWREED